MNNMILLLVLAALSLPLLRLAAVPVRFLAKLYLHGLLGLACLWLLNSTVRFTGVTIPINTVTALLAGYLGVPGILLTMVLGGM